MMKLRDADLIQTRDAFDSVADDYDGDRGNNPLIQDMRQEMWRWLDATFPSDSKLIDVGCGTGLDAIRMAQRGHEVTATDWSPAMVQRTRERAALARLTGQVNAIAIGGQEFHHLTRPGTYDGAYSNLGPLNCVPELPEFARQCARLLKPRGSLVFTVIGRVCPWEIIHYARQGRWSRIKVRYARQPVSVGLNKRTVWTHYYSPREFYRAFAPHFAVDHYRALCLFAPPPYLTSVRERHARTYDWLWRLDRRCANWPLLRDMGDHFLMILRKR
jgi:SAM-dependent methyltransferase